MIVAVWLARVDARFDARPLGIRLSWLRSRAASCASTVLLAWAATSCSSDFEKYKSETSTRGSFGEEVYKDVCRRMAGTDMPADVAGARSSAICLGDSATVQAALEQAEAASVSTPVDVPGGPSDAGTPAVSSAADALTPRLLALAARRAQIVQAIDDTFSDELADALEHVFRALLPFYDPPEERIEWASRELAAWFQRLADPSRPDVLAGLARVTRPGMLPPEGNYGLLRGLLGGQHMRDVGQSMLPLVLDDPEVSVHFDTLLAGLSLELATFDDGAHADDLQHLKDLLTRHDDAFGTGTPLLATLRDARGLPGVAKQQPKGGIDPAPAPFVDADGDRLPDADGPRLKTQPTFVGPLPEPFPVLGEVGVMRDAQGRALLDGAPLYQSDDADTTLLAGLLRSAQKLFRDDSLSQQLSLATPSFFGDPLPTTKAYGPLLFAYRGPSVSGSPVIGLAHGVNALLDRDVTLASLDLGKQLFVDHEDAIANLVGPLVTLADRAKDGPDDAYPNAKLAAGHTLWDELLAQVEMISRRRTSATSDTLLEAMMRASLGYARDLSQPGAPIAQVVDPTLLSHQGVVLSALMRFKDEWRSNPTGQSKRSPDEPAVLGSFRQPVDRTQPDLPTTCGKDGCGGLIEQTPFARWRQPNQQCVIQRLGRPITGRDCGRAPNQSLLQRSLGLIYEMAGRSQCNKPITIGNLLDYAVLKDPCVGGVLPDSPACDAARQQQADERSRSVTSAENAVRDDYACPPNADASAPCKAYATTYPAAFADTDGQGGAPATIQACHMLNLPDVGRTFGAAILHEYQLEFPNPWVRRYLEDVARAGDHDGDGSADLPACDASYQIVDPTVVPPCIPEAASLSRDVYKDMPGSVDTLGELVEFLLDDTGLFTNDDDTRALRPDVTALSRVLFAPAGSTSFLLFDPLLLRGAPAQCAAASAIPACAKDDTSPTPAGGCCIKDLTEPPLRYRLDTYYGSTSFAWQQPIQLSDGTSMSFLDVMKPLSDAVERYDYRAGIDDPTQFEDTSYLFTTLGKLIAEHYDSKANTAAQSTDPNGIHYRHLTGLVTYEAMIADALDDGSLAFSQSGPDGLALFTPSISPKPDTQLGLVQKGLSLLATLAGVHTSDGRDGIDIGAAVAEELFNPHAHCAGSIADRRVLGGIGACDLAAANVPKLEPPFATVDGSTTVCWTDGTCFDGILRPKRYVSPATVIFDALGAMEDRARRTVDEDVAFDGALAGLLDAYASVQAGRFADRRVHALITTLIDYLSERVQDERDGGTIGSFAARMDQDAVDLIHNPVVGGALALFSALHGRGTALADLSAYAVSVLSEGGDANNLRPLVAGAFDMVQLLPGDAQTNAALRTLGSAFSANVEPALAGATTDLSPRTSAIGRNLFMLRQLAAADTGTPSVLEQSMHNLVRIPPGRPSPLEVFLDAVIETNRVRSGEFGPPTADDLRAVLMTMADTFLDDRHGLERLYAIVRCTRAGANSAGCQ